ncbi:uncharacterized protein LOC131438651 [Malaya genurostris]|uniref:uncharacterized protein LOC131438651 n=1 Tax=Malaya genurostris TaxID=325434 RepID=UPI0026F3BD04|nr:uncharacterized protein LOC131438651 [Malaya genurostris]XP_058464788.1 uncharacterized protein LOC131438651 [Malaya genurostris]
MLEVERFRIVGYVYAVGCMVYSVIEIVAAVNTLMGDECDKDAFIKLMMATLFLTFNIFLLIGISTANMANVHANAIFTIIFDLIVIINVLTSLSIRMFNGESFDRKSEGVVTLVLVTLFLALSIGQIWILTGVRRYVKTRQRAT